MLENIPDFKYFLEHSFSIQTDKEGNNISVRKIDLHPAIKECQVIKIPAKSNNDIPPIIYTDLTIEHGSVTKKSYIKPKVYQLEGRHKIVYCTRDNNTSVVVRTDKYPLLWLCYWISLRTMASVNIARKSLTIASQQWRLGLGVVWRSLSGLMRMTHDTFKSMTAAIWREWTR